MTVVILEDAAEDLESGAQFYESCATGVGDYFLDSILSDLDSLVLFAGVHPIYFDFSGFGNVCGREDRQAFRSLTLSNSGGTLFAITWGQMVQVSENHSRQKKAGSVWQPKKVQSDQPRRNLRQHQVRSEGARSQVARVRPAF
jgi:hypothetical protein